MLVRKAASKPIYQSEEAELGEKLVQQLLSFSKHIDCTEPALGSLEHKLTVIKCLQGLGPVFHQMHLFMNYCFASKEELEIYIPKALPQGHSAFFRKVYKFWLYC